MSVERVGPMARVPGCVAPTPSEEAETSGDGEGHGHAVVVQMIVLLVRVHADDGEDDGQNGEGGQHDPEGHLAHQAAVHRHAGPAQLTDSVQGLSVSGGIGSPVAVVVRGRGWSGGGRHCHRGMVAVGGACFLGAFGPCDAVLKPESTASGRINKPETHA